MTTNKEITLAARTAATFALQSVHASIREIVHHEAMRVVPRAEAEKVMDSFPKRPRGYITPPSKGLSDFARILLQSAEWQKGRGEVLASAIMIKPGTKEKTFISQYRCECSLLKMDKSQPCSTFFKNGRVDQLGKSVWVKFEPIQGVLEDAVAYLRKQGWILQPVEKTVQMTIVDA